MIMNKSKVITYPDGRQIYVDEHTEFLDKMIGTLKYEIFVLKNGSLKNKEKELENTKKHKMEYAEKKLKELNENTRRNDERQR